MLQLINVSVNYGRLKESIRTRLVEADSALVMTWGAIDDCEGACQSACRATLTGPGLAWDSGWIEKKDQSLRYEGPLPEGEPIVLTIQIRDDKGNESNIYTNTIYNASISWKAGWIGAARDEAGRTVYLRREFFVDRPLSSAVLYACGVGYQKLYANGKALDDTALDPANTDYSKTCQYVVYPEFKDALQPGKNCLGALLGEGWRKNVLVKADEGGDLGNRKPYAGKPVFSVMLRLT